MTKMNWEHRNRMQKVYDNRPSRSVGKRKSKKGTRRPNHKKETVQGHVGLLSKYDSKCADCGTCSMITVSKSCVIHEFDNRKDMPYNVLHEGV